jgi:integration host factor subunit alpha
MTLTKVHIVKAVAEQIGHTKKRTIITIEILLELIKRSLESGDDFFVTGFGKFHVKEKHERRVRNPATGEDMMLEPRRVVTFNCFRNLRDRVNGKQH